MNCVFHKVLFVWNVNAQSIVISKSVVGELQNEDHGGCTVGKMLATVRDTIPSNCAYMIFEELILAPFSIARMRENFKRRRRRQQNTKKGVE